MSESPDLLISLAIAAAHQLGYTCRLAPRDEVLLCGPAGSVLVSLSDLRRLADDEPRDQWPALVADYLWGTVGGGADGVGEHSTGLIDLETGSDPLDTRDFTAMRALLRTRLYSDSGAGAAVGRPVAPSLIQRVLIDQMHTMAPVTRTMLRHWPITEGELFALAERNTRADGPLDTVVHEIDSPADSVALTMLYGLSDYVTAHAKWLDDYPVAGPAGTVFAVPSQRYIYAHPVTDPEVLRATTVLAQLAVLGYAHRPWPVSQDVYWWHDGAIDLAAATAHDGAQLRIYPTSGFLAALGRLAS